MSALVAGLVLVLVLGVMLLVAWLLLRCVGEPAPAPVPVEVEP